MFRLSYATAVVLPYAGAACEAKAVALRSAQTASDAALATSRKALAALLGSWLMYTETGPVAPAVETGSDYRSS